MGGHQNQAHGKALGNFPHISFENFVNLLKVRLS